MPAQPWASGKPTSAIQRAGAGSAPYRARSGLFPSGYWSIRASRWLRQDHVVSPTTSCYHTCPPSLSPSLPSPRRAQTPICLQPPVSGGSSQGLHCMGESRGCHVVELGGMPRMEIVLPQIQPLTRILGSWSLAFQLRSISAHCLGSSWPCSAICSGRCWLMPAPSAAIAAAPWICATRSQLLAWQPQTLLRKGLVPASPLQRVLGRGPERTCARSLRPCPDPLGIP